MKKIILTFCFYISFISLSAQDFEQIIMNDFCSCLEEFDQNKSEVTFKLDFEDCQESIILKRKDEINSYLLEKIGPIENISPQEAHDFGYNLMDEIFNNNLNFLVYECKPFYQLIENSRKREIDFLAKNTDEKQIEYLTEKIEKYTLKSVFLMQRGKTYFELKKYPEARIDLKKVLEEDSQNLQALLYLALLEDFSGNYEEAIDLYDKLISKSSFNEIKIFKELAKRKMSEGKE